MEFIDTLNASCLPLYTCFMKVSLAFAMSFFAFLRLSARVSNSTSTDHPERVGPYRILQVLGEGGMGVVYEAEQIEPVRRRVALKVIKSGMDTREVVARFEAEQQALAVMDHPNIATVFDAGATGGLVSSRTEGTPQGGPLSPLLSNILLDELDKELERRGHPLSVMPMTVMCT